MLTIESKVPLTALAITPNGEAIVTDYGGSRLAVWSTVGRPKMIFSGHSSQVTTAAVGLKGVVIATAALDATIRVWDRHTGRKLALLQGHTEAVDFVTVSERKFVFSASLQDHTVRVWDIAHPRVATCPIIRPTRAGTAIAVAHDGHAYALALHDKSIRLFDVTAGTQLTVMRGPRNWTRAIAFVVGTLLRRPHDDMYTLLTGSDDGSVRLWECKKGYEVHCFQGHTGPVLSVDAAESIHIGVSGGVDGTVRIWDLTTGLPLRLLADSPHAVLQVKVTPSGGHVACTTQDNKVMSWHLAERAIGVNALAVEGTMGCGRHERKSVQAMIGLGQCLTIAQPGGVQGVLEPANSAAEGDAVMLVAIARHGHGRTVTCDKSNNVNLWDLMGSRKEKKTERTEDETGGSALASVSLPVQTVTAVGISGDGSRVVCGLDDDTVALLDGNNELELVASLTPEKMKPRTKHRQRNGVDGGSAAASPVGGGVMRVAVGHGGDCVAVAHKMAGKVFLWTRKEKEASDKKEGKEDDDDDDEEEEEEEEGEETKWTYSVISDETLTGVTCMTIGEGKNTTGERCIVMGCAYYDCRMDASGDVIPAAYVVRRVSVATGRETGRVKLARQVVQVAVVEVATTQTGGGEQVVAVDAEGRATLIEWEMGRVTLIGEDVEVVCSAFDGVYGAVAGEVRRLVPKEEEQEEKEGGEMEVCV